MRGGEMDAGLRRCRRDDGWRDKGGPFGHAVRKSLAKFTGAENSFQARDLFQLFPPGR
jgi:hypothetical protein